MVLTLQTIKLESYLRHVKLLVRRYDRKFCSGQLRRVLDLFTKDLIN